MLFIFQIAMGIILGGIGLMFLYDIYLLIFKGVNPLEDGTKAMAELDEEESLEELANQIDYGEDSREKEARDSY